MNQDVNKKVRFGIVGNEIVLILRSKTKKMFVIRVGRQNWGGGHKWYGIVIAFTTGSAQLNKSIRIGWWKKP